MSTGTDTDVGEETERAPRGERYDDATFLDAVAQLADDPERTPTTSAIADVVGCGTSTANRRCRALADEGRGGERGGRRRQRRGRRRPARPRQRGRAERRVRSRQRTGGGRQARARRRARPRRGPRAELTRPLTSPDVSYHPLDQFASAGDSGADGRYSPLSSRFGVRCPSPRPGTYHAVRRFFGRRPAYVLTPSAA